MGVKAVTYKSERDVKREIKKVLDKYGWFWFSPPANTFGVTGISDILALRAGVFLAVEAKYNGNTPTGPQKGFLETVSAESGFGFVVDEKTLPLFARWAELFDKSAKSVETGGSVSDEDGAEMLDCIAAMTAPVVAVKRRARAS